MTLYTYPIKIEKEGAQYYASVDDLPGVYGVGKTVEAAKKAFCAAQSSTLIIATRSANHCRLNGTFTPKP